MAELHQVSNCNHAFFVMLKPFCHNLAARVLNLAWQRDSFDSLQLLSKQANGLGTVLPVGRSQSNQCGEEV
jgi:hypothetical protein